MSPQLADILNQIDTFRQTLGELVKNRCMNDPEVIRESQRLDLLLNDYYKLAPNGKYWT